MLIMTHCSSNNAANVAQILSHEQLITQNYFGHMRLHTRALTHQ